MLTAPNMIREALSRDEDAGRDSGSLSFKTMLMLAVATSIDALAAGITFASVSYTHLEVYKRQALSRGAGKYTARRRRWGARPWKRAGRCTTGLGKGWRGTCNLL